MMFKKKKIKSIKTSIRDTFIMVFGVMIIIFYISFFMKNIIIKEYNNSMKTSMLINNLSFELNNYAVLFDRYIRKRDEEIYVEYIKSRYKINKYFDEIKSKIKDKKSLTFFRNLKNMYDFQINLAGEIVKEEMLNENTYEKITQIKTMFAYMNRHVQSLSVAYLEYSAKRYSDLLKRYRIIENNLYILFSILAFVMFIFIIKRVKNILSTVDSLTRAAKLLSEAHWEISDIEETYYVEFDTLAFAFNKMKKNIKMFIEELNKKAELEINLNKARMKNIEKDKLLKESQLRILQAQMDPHFLFNTLNTISRVAMFENAVKSIKLIESISKILRYNLEHVGKLVTVQEEITVLKAYGIIQETRFHEQMSFKFDIDKNISDIMIPPMIIQPIMENAIIHGLQEKLSYGEVCISLKKYNEMLRIDVEDNGKGMTVNEINSILKNEKLIENKVKKKTTKIGLSNINKMLKLYFNKDNLLFIKSELNKGTKVSIFIPIIREKI